MRRSIVAIFALLALALTAPAGSSAAAPEIVRTAVAPEIPGFMECAGFNVDASLQGTVTRVFRDDRTDVYRRLTGTLTNTATGEIFPVREHDHVTITESGRIMRGDLLHVVVPGTGTVVLIAGRETDEGSRGRFIEPCEALA